MQSLLQRFGCSWAAAVMLRSCERNHSQFQWQGSSVWWCALVDCVHQSCCTTARTSLAWGEVWHSHSLTMLEDIVYSWKTREGSTSEPHSISSISFHLIPFAAAVTAPSHGFWQQTLIICLFSLLRCWAALLMPLPLASGVSRRCDNHVWSCVALGEEDETS